MDGPTTGPPNLLDWWSETNVKEYRLKATLLQKTSLFCPWTDGLSLYSTLEVASASKITHALK